MYTFILIKYACKNYNTYIYINTIQIAIDKRT